jgi:hypothetical protein
MLDCEEVELFPLKEGYYLLCLPLGQPAKPQLREAERINERERGVLKKLLSIRFENRVPAYVSKALTDQEKAVLKELERRGFVNVFKGAKYKDGVYNISDSIYPLLSKEAQPAAVPAPNDLAAVLKRQGYLVIADKNEARALSERLGQEMKSGTFVGVRGFDGKFYIVTRSYLAAAQAAIAAVLKEDMDAAGIAAAAKLEPDGCLAVLRIMSENGDVLEKKRGVFAPV